MLLGLGLFFFTWLRLFAPFLRLFQFFLGILDDPADLFKTKKLSCLEPFKDSCSGDGRGLSRRNQVSALQPQFRHQCRFFPEHSAQRHRPFGCA
jgi:hypothetical protein